MHWILITVGCSALAAALLLVHLLRLVVFLVRKWAMAIERKQRDLRNRKMAPTAYAKRRNYSEKARTLASAMRHFGHLSKDVEAAIAAHREPLEPPAWD